VSVARPTPPDGTLVTAPGGRDGGRIYVVVAGVKRWIVSPEVFLERGWRFEDVQRISDAELEAIPTSQLVIGAEPSFVDRDAARLRASAPFLAGRGLEIGAGMTPQPLPPGALGELFELRSAAEVARMEAASRAAAVRPEDVPRFRSLDDIAECFPAGADFLIAHNVLEHCAEPIGTLHQWISYLRTGGVLVLSVPDLEHCADASRVVPDLEHLLLDHVLHRDGDSFESREHAYSCAAGWVNTWEDWLPLDKLAVAARMHAMAKMPALDVHWHAFTPLLFDELLQAASALGSAPLHLLAWSDPYETGAARTVGDIIAVLRLGEPLGEDPRPGWRATDVASRVAAFAARLDGAARRLAGRAAAQRSS
jgi:SAM-dependent methyltransferase